MMCKPVFNILTRKTNKQKILNVITFRENIRHLFILIKKCLLNACWLQSSVLPSRVIELIEIISLVANFISFLEDTEK